MNAERSFDLCVFLVATSTTRSPEIESCIDYGKSLYSRRLLHWYIMV